MHSLWPFSLEMILTAFTNKEHASGPFLLFLTMQDFSFGGLGDKTHSTEFSCGKSDSEY